MKPMSLIARNYTFTHRITNFTLDGISHEESLIHPPNGGNCINWIVGHILLSRDDVFERLGIERVWTDREATAAYDRGSTLLTDSGKAVELSVLLDLFNQTQPLLLEAMENLNKVPSEDGKMEESVAFYNFHEAYHLGQIAILRRFLGKESIIK